MKTMLLTVVLVVGMASVTVICHAQDELDRKLVPTGTFTGQVVNGPKLDTNNTWVFVQGAKGTSRKVDIASAKVTYAASVAKKNRAAKPEDGVREGARIRVTAMQEGDGWRATEIEILKPAPK